jgi:hypothetical protein
LASGRSGGGSARLEPVPQTRSDGRLGGGGSGGRDGPHPA